MSNEYKDWFDDRAYEAWDDITKIAELIEEWEEFKDGSQSYEYFSKIRDVMKKGGWI